MELVKFFTVLVHNKCATNYK